MQFSGGDYIALGMFGLGALGFAVREWRATVSMRSKQVADKVAMESVVGTLTAKMEELSQEWRVLDGKRQNHELECARVQERTASTQERLAAVLDRQGRDIQHLQAQVSNLGPGANTYSQILPAERSKS